MVLSDTKNAPNINIFWSSLLVEELHRQGCSTFFIAPGSRSTPLTYSVSQNTKVQTFVGYDERALAFSALGFAKSKQTPVAIIVTSGTALANLHPAVCEAREQEIPLILLTADRPPELHGVCANQTQNQREFFGHQTTAFFQLPTPSEAIKPRYVLNLVDDAVEQAEFGPVQINCQFRDPLAPVEHIFQSPQDALFNNWLEHGYPFRQKVTNSHLDFCVEKTLVILGEGANIKEVNKIGMPVHADLLSNAQDRPNLDLLLASSRFREFFKPEQVVHLGGRIVSKRLMDHLEQFPPKRTLLVHQGKKRFNPGLTVTHTLEANPEEYAKYLFLKRPKSLWSQVLCRAHKAATEAFEKQIGESRTLSEPFVARTVAQAVPAGEILFVGNSMPIRDMDNFATKLQPSVRVMGNRGLSGIDGLLSTALGLGNGCQKPITLLLGDLSFLHDVGGLALIKDAQKRVTIVVVNNGGGGIFSFLPISKSQEVFKKYWETPQDLDLGAICRGYGLSHKKVYEKSDLDTSLVEAFTKDRHCVIEVRTDRSMNKLVHEDLQNAVVTATEKTLGEIL